MFNVQGFSENLKAKLVAAGFNEQEMKLGALFAEMEAAMKLISNPIVAMAISDTFAKVMALLSEGKAEPERITSAADIIFNAATSAAEEHLATMKESVEEHLATMQESAVRRTVVLNLDDTPANDPKDIN